MFLALVDPFGNYQAYNSPQGTGNFAHVDARNPAPGTWKAMVWANPLFTGKISYEFTTSRYATYGTVHPSTRDACARRQGDGHRKFPRARTPGTCRQQS